jgi:hypothetical protein
VHGEDHDLGAGDAVAHLTGGLHAVEHRHGDIHEDHVGPELLGQAHGLGPVGRLAHDVEAVLLHRPPQRLAQHAVVVGEQQPHRVVLRLCPSLAHWFSSLQRTVVPRPCTDSNSSAAPMASARSRMPSIP